MIVSVASVPIRVKKGVGYLFWGLKGILGNKVVTQTNNLVITTLVSQILCYFSTTMGQPKAPGSRSPPIWEAPSFLVSLAEGPGCLAVVALAQL